MRGLNADLMHIAEEAGVDQVVLDYLRARRALSTGVLGSMAKNWDKVDALLVQPPENGYTVDGVTHQVAAADIPLAKAQIWKTSYEQLESTPMGSQTTAPTAPSADTTSHAKTPPKELPPDVHKDLLAKYEDQKIDGIR